MKTTKAIVILLVVLACSFLLHKNVAVAKGVSRQVVALSYALNFLLTALILAALLNLPERLKNSLGYFFMFGSMAKFALYFVVFAPLFRADGQIAKSEFFTFFVPYALSLIVETTVLVRQLNQRSN